MSRRPPSMCKALGRRERMRFDSPAARITAVRPLIIASRLACPMPPLRPPAPMPTAGPKYLQICTPSPSPVSQMRQDGLDPVGQWRRELDALARRGMDEGQPGRVKGNPAQALDQLAGNRIAALAPAIGHVSDQGMAEGSEVDTDLMGTPRLETALEVRDAGETLENPEARDGALAGAGTRHRHANP